MRYWNPNECVLILMVMLVLAMSMFKHYQNCHNIVTQMSSYCHNSMVDYTHKNILSNRTSPLSPCVSRFGSDHDSESSRLTTLIYFNNFLTKS